MPAARAIRTRSSHSHYPYGSGISFPCLPKRQRRQVSLLHFPTQHRHPLSASTAPTPIVTEAKACPSVRVLLFLPYGLYVFRQRGYNIFVPLGAGLALDFILQMANIVGEQIRHEQAVKWVHVDILPVLYRYEERSHGPHGDSRSIKTTVVD